MKTKTHTGRKRGKRIILALVILLLICLVLSLAAGNYLFRFALDPSFEKGLPAAFAQPSTKPTAEAEDAMGNSYTDTRMWQEYSAEAAQWFREARNSWSLTAEDNTLRTGSYFANQGHGYAIVCHGYGADSSQMAGYCRMFYDLGLSVLAPDAMAHGSSGGDYIGMGWLERKDLLGWINRIIDRDPQAEILLFGISMGGATVMMTAGEELPHQVKCVVEDCGYTSVMDEFSVQIDQLIGLPSFPLLYTADLVCRLRAGYWFGSASAVEQLKKAEVPMLFIHGERDTFVPYWMLDQVYEACASPVKEKLSIPGASHGAAAAVDPVKYWNTIEEFVGRFITLKETE